MNDETGAATADGGGDVAQPADTGRPPLPYAGPPPLAYRLRPPQVLLGVGAVLVVSAAAAASAAYGGDTARGVLLLLAVAGAVTSVAAGAAGLRSTEETLAAASVALAFIGSDLGSSGQVLGVGLAFALAALFLLLHLVLPSSATWPLASWAAFQIGVLRTLVSVQPPVLHTAVLLGVALVGLGITLAGRPVIAVPVLVTTAPWWVAGVVDGSRTAWTGEGATRWLSAVLVVGAAAGLLVVRVREPVEPLLGPPGAVPVLSGLVAGVAVAGAFSLPAPPALPLAAYLGVLLAALADALLSGWPRGMLLPAALTAGAALTALSLGQLVHESRWAALSLLLLLAALPTAFVAVHRPEDRPDTLPVTVGCLAGAVLVALVGDLLPLSGAALLLTVLYAAALATGSRLDPAARRPTVVAGAVCATAAVVLLVVLRDRAILAVDLAVQGLLTCAWARHARRLAESGRDDREPDSRSPGSLAWRLGAAQLVLAAWTTAAVHAITVPETYTLPAAVGMLIAGAPRLAAGPTWPAWGPGLLVAAAPSTALAIVAPGSLRPVLVMVAAGVVMTAGARWGLRAPLLVGAGTAVAVGLGLAVVRLPLPALGALAVGLALLVLGASRERHPVAGFAERLAQMR